MQLPSGNRPWLDGAAIAASFLCLAHCLLLPILLTALPALATRFDLPPYVHVAALLVALPTSSLALIGGYRRHGTIIPLVVGLFGLSALTVGALGGADIAVETALTVFGSIVLAICHIANWRLIRRANRPRNKGIAIGAQPG